MIATAHAEADPVLSQGKSQHYSDAVRWLGRAKAAYQAAGRDADWQSYLAGLLAQHRRKYTLMPLLQTL